MRLKNNLNIKESLRVGMSFGLTSAIITTLGLMIGLYSSTRSKLAVIGGILTIAIADAFSDALGIHVAEESENRHSQKEVWLSTIFTFFTKFFFTLTFIIPVLIFEIRLAISINIIWGLVVLSLLSYLIAKNQKEKAYKIISEHVFIAIIVIILANLIGNIINKTLT